MYVHTGKYDYLMPATKAVQVRFSETTLRLIDALGSKLGIETRAGVIKYCLARVAGDEAITTPKAKK